MDMPVLLAQENGATVEVTRVTDCHSFMARVFSSVWPTILLLFIYICRTVLLPVLCPVRGNGTVWHTSAPSLWQGLPIILNNRSVCLVLCPNFIIERPIRRPKQTINSDSIVFYVFYFQNSLTSAENRFERGRQSKSKPFLPLLAD